MEGAVECGICLEQRTPGERGGIDSCDHFFCFPCIHKWSRVESRCPVCKQRFANITKPTPTTNNATTRKRKCRTSTIKVPSRDQVYKPTLEEVELASQSNPMCTICFQPGDDLFVCGRCTAAAHVGCIGEGRLGDWLCTACSALPVLSSFTLPGMSVEEEVVQSVIIRSRFETSGLVSVSFSSASMIQRVQDIRESWNELRNETMTFMAVARRTSEPPTRRQTRRQQIDQQQQQQQEQQEEQSPRRDPEIDRAWQMFEQARATSTPAATETPPSRRVSRRGGTSAARRTPAARVGETRGNGGEGDEDGGTSGHRHPICTSRRRLRSGSSASSSSARGGLERGESSGANEAEDRRAKRMRSSE